METRLTEKRWFRALLHTCTWLGVLTLPYLLLYNPDRRDVTHPEVSRFLILNGITNLIWVGLFYLNAYLFIPKLLYKKRYVQYVIALLATIIAVLLFHKMVLFPFVPQIKFTWKLAIAFNLPIAMLSIAASLSFRLLIDHSRTQRLNLEKQKENLKTELSFLRSQISPHFVFNVLNNMLALSRLKSDQLEPTIFKLSSLMRYMLYEADHELVPIAKEYNYLNSYIDLQLQRLGKKDILSVNFNEPDNQYMIAPMLLVPFIENAFKHGIGNADTSFVDISLQVVDSVLLLKVKNSIAVQQKDASSGIGLVNVRRRLDLLYKNGYRLDISSDKEVFSVELELNLNKYAPVYSSR